MSRFQKISIQTKNTFLYKNISVRLSLVSLGWVRCTADLKKLREILEFFEPTPSTFPIYVKIIFVKRFMRNKTKIIFLFVVKFLQVSSSFIRFIQQTLLPKALGWNRRLVQLYPDDKTLNSPEKLKNWKKCFEAEMHNR